jgi:hypothetical protein
VESRRVRVSGNRLHFFPGPRRGSRIRTRMGLFLSSDGFWFCSVPAASGQRPFAFLSRSETNTLCNLARGRVILPVGTGLPVTASSVGRKSEDYVAEATLRLFMPPLSHPRRSENPASPSPDPGPWLAAYPAGSPPRCTAVPDASCTVIIDPTSCDLIPRNSPAEAMESKTNGIGLRGSLNQSWTPRWDRAQAVQGSMGNG